MFEGNGAAKMCGGGDYNNNNNNDNNKQQQQQQQQQQKPTPQNAMNPKNQTQKLIIFQKQNQKTTTKEKP